MGETESEPHPPGVLRNSPADTDQRRLPGRRVALFTVNGTRTLATMPPGGALTAAAAVNVRATAAWIRARDAGRVRVVVSDPAAPEDYACATYLTGLLRSAPVDSATISQAIEFGRAAHWERWGHEASPDTWRAFEVDVEVCARLDTYPIAITVDRSSGPLPVLRPVAMEQVGR